MQFLKPPKQILYKLSTEGFKFLMRLKPYQDNVFRFFYLGVYLQMYEAFQSELILVDDLFINNLSLNIIA